MLVSAFLSTVQALSNIDRFRTFFLNLPDTVDNQLIPSHLLLAPSPVNVSPVEMPRTVTHVQSSSVAKAPIPPDVDRGSRVGLMTFLPKSQSAAVIASSSTITANPSSSSSSSSSSASSSAAATAVSSLFPSVAAHLPPLAMDSSDDLPPLLPPGVPQLRRADTELILRDAESKKKFTFQEVTMCAGYH